MNIHEIAGHMLAEGKDVEAKRLLNEWQDLEDGHGPVTRDPISSPNFSSNRPRPAPEIRKMIAEFLVEVTLAVVLVVWGILHYRQRLGYRRGGR